MMGIRSSVRIALTQLIGRDFSSPSLTRLVRDSRIISFDVFDTLIIRPGLKTPSDLFNLIHPEDPTFKARRLEAARISKLEAEAQRLEDRTLTDIYKHLPEYDEKDEINAELSVCKANKFAQDFYNRCREEGKCIIIISDMYLSASTIERILINCGYDLTGVNVYVSSEYGKTKRSGNLFREVLRVLREEGKHVLHIGDNYISDYLNPRKRGMKGFLYCSR